MSSDGPKEAKVLWVPKSQVDPLLEMYSEKAEIAEHLISDHYLGVLPATPSARLLLKELYCVITKMVSYLRDSLIEGRHESQNQEGYLLTKESAIVLSTLSLQVSEVTQELASLNLSTEVH
tara:strand:+ start:76 stop:438 length:363 start_codon:yes stop_codon:yes gene_type:complete